MKKVLLLLLILFAGYLLYPYTPMPRDTVVDKLLVDKSDRKLHVLSKGTIIKSFTISLGDNPIGHKEKKDDEKTPEGTYFINDKRGFGQSGYYKNLGISYPSPRDKAHAKRMGVNPGGEIKIHGLKNGLGFIGRLQRWKDWTNGCMALTNQEMEDLWQHVKVGTVIEIRP